MGVSIAPTELMNKAAAGYPAWSGCKNMILKKYAIVVLIVKMASTRLLSNVESLQTLLATTLNSNAPALTFAGRNFNVVTKKITAQMELMNRPAAGFLVLSG